MTLIFINECTFTITFIFPCKRIPRCRWTISYTWKLLCDILYFVIQFRNDSISAWNGIALNVANKYSILLYPTQHFLLVVILQIGIVKRFTAGFLRCNISINCNTPLTLYEFYKRIKKDYGVSKYIVHLYIFPMLLLWTNCIVFNSFDSGSKNERIE